MKNNRGFTLIEVLVTFTLITGVSIAFFKTTISLQQQQLKNIAKNDYKAFAIVLNNSIQSDFLNNKITKISSCGESCYNIAYEDEEVNLSIDKENNVILYGDIKEAIPKDYKLIGDIEINNYVGSSDGNDSYITFSISLKSNYEKNINSIKYMYQYDNDFDTIEFE